jgi:hypothetical protein
MQYEPQNILLMMSTHALPPFFFNLLKMSLTSTV